MKKIKYLFLFLFYPNWRVVKVYPAMWNKNGVMSYRFNYVILYSSSRDKFKIEVEGEIQDYKDHEVYTKVLEDLSILNIETIIKEHKLSKAINAL